MKMNRGKLKKISIALIVAAILSYAFSIDQLLFNIVLNSMLLAATCVLVILQNNERRRLDDVLNTQRRAWLALFIIAAFSFVPIIMSQFLKYMGQPSDLLIMVSTVLSPIQRASIYGILFWIYISPIKKM